MGPGVLATGGYDRKISLLKEIGDSQWRVAYSDNLNDKSAFQSAVNKVAFAPYERGLVIAGAGADGSVGIVSYVCENFHRTSFKAYSSGVRSLAFSPFCSTSVPNSLEGAQICTGGEDGKLRVFTHEQGQWIPTTDVFEKAHVGSVNNISWRDSTHEGGQKLIASGGSDGLVLIHSRL